jgi:N-acetylmuramoyl-L-alanine amidase
LQEKNVTLAVALLVGPILTAAGIQVIYTRTSDVVPWPANVNADLQMRCDIANNAKADAFLSIHCNAATDPTAHGSESFCYALGGKGQVLAGDVLTPLVAAIGTVNRGVAAANYEVLRNTSMPAALVETAFISDPAEEAMLRNPAKLAKIAQAIASGILSYFGASPQPQVTPGVNVRGKFIPGQIDGQGHLTAQVAPILQALGIAYTWNTATETLTVN